MKREPPYCFYDESLPDWGVERITLAEDANGDLYFPLRPLCDALAIDRATQAGIVRNDGRTRGGVRDIRMPSPGGMQPTLCVRKREVSIWLATIDPDRIGPRAKARGKLSEFQAALWHLAERIAFKSKASAEASATAAPAIATWEGVKRTSTCCPDCGAPLIAEERGDKLYLWHASIGAGAE